MHAMPAHASKADIGAGTLRSAALVLLGIAGLIGAGVLWGDSTVEVPWDYQGDRGPAQWGSLDETFSACAAGAEQSPIDLVDGATGDYPAVEFDYGPRIGTVVNNGHTVQVNVDQGSGIILDGTRYELLQFHFHHGSEHTVGGAQLLMEMHLVHRSDGGALAVVGVLLDEGAANETLAPIWERFPRQGNRAVGVARGARGGGAAAGAADGLALPRIAHHPAVYRGGILDRDDRARHAVRGADRRVRRHLSAQLPARAAAQPAHSGPQLRAAAEEHPNPPRHDDRLVHIPAYLRR